MCRAVVLIIKPIVFSSCRRRRRSYLSSVMTLVEQDFCEQDFF